MRRGLMILLGSLAILVAIAFLLRLFEHSEAERNTAATSANAEAAVRIPVTVSSPVEETLSTIPLPDSGRLTIAADALPRREAITFALPLAEGAIGNTPLSARIVDIEGRVLDIQVNPIPSDPTSATLVLDSEWLTPGSYMIQVRTQEQSALPLRRFVLIIE